MKNKIFKHLLLLGTELLLFIVINILLASLMFIFKVGITSHYVMISLFFCIIVTVYLSIKEKILTKKNYYLGILYIVFPLVIIHYSIYLNGKVVDTSYDGNAYQKAIVGLLKDGWNPIYESSEDFDESNEHKIYLKESGHYLWVDHYAKASHIYQANIYALTGNIESGKSINTLSIISLSLILFSLMALHFKKVLFPLFFTICAITPSFVCAQFLTNYIDLLVYIYLLLLILSLFYLDYNEQKRIGFVIYLSCLLMLINIKFNSFAYAGLYCLGYYIYFIVKLKKGILNKKFFWKFTGISAIGVILGVFVIGLSVYPKNLIEKGNPFYPIYGKGKVDIISMYQPASFKNMSTPKKYFISMFSKVDNIGWWSNYEPILKIPFSYDDKEIDVIKSSDTRISGNGVIFGGIFIISSCLTLVLSFIMLKKDKKMFVLCTILLSITIILIFLLSESWWARYFPQTYFIILISLLYLYKCNNNLSLVTLTVIIMLLLYNNFITFRESVNYAIEYKQELKGEIELIQNDLNKKDKLILKSSSYLGAFYNLKDSFKNYNVEIIENIDQDKNVYKNIFSSQIKWRIEKSEIKKETKKETKNGGKNEKLSKTNKNKTLD